MTFFVLPRANSISNSNHPPTYAEEAKSLRDKRQAEEAQKRAEAQANAQRKADEEERRRVLDTAKMEAQAPPGMIWNNKSREYEYLHDPTEESWRD